MGRRHDGTPLVCAYCATPLRVRHPLGVCPHCGSEFPTASVPDPTDCIPESLPDATLMVAAAVAWLARATMTGFYCATCGLNAELRGVTDHRPACWRCINDGHAPDVSASSPVQAVEDVLHEHDREDHDD